MYTDADLGHVNEQKNRRLVAAFAVLALAICVLIAGLISRIAPLATFGTAGFCCLFYAVLELKAMPYVRYARFLRDVDEGLSHAMDAEYVSTSTEPRMNNGVLFYDFFVRVGPEDEDERLFYFDADKPLPSIQPGQALHITSFGNYVTGLESGGQKLC